MLFFFFISADGGNLMRYLQLIGRGLNCYPSHIKIS